MKLATAIAQGFMNEPKELKEVLELTCKFLGRKIDRKEFNSIVKAYKNAMERWAFYGSQQCL